MRKLLARSGTSRTTRPAAITRSDSRSSSLTPTFADVRIGERDDLPGITRVGENFLIARHRGVEHHLTDGVTGRTDALAVEHRSVGKDEDRGIERHDGSLQWIQRCVSCPPKKTGWARFAIPFFTFIFYRENLPAAIAAPFSASPARRACRRDRAGALQETRRTHGPHGIGHAALRTVGDLDALTGTGKEHGVVPHDTPRRGSVEKPICRDGRTPTSPWRP